jgi:hypothetical protein
MPRGIAHDPETKRQKQSESGRKAWAARHGELAVLRAWAHFTLREWPNARDADMYPRVMELVARGD